MASWRLIYLQYLEQYKIMNNFESRTLAFAGIFRAAALVNTLANEGTISEDDLRISIESIFETDPENVTQVFGSTKNLSLGFQTMIYQFGKILTSEILMSLVMLLACYFLNGDS